MKKRKARPMSFPEGLKRPPAKRPAKVIHMISDHALVRYMSRVMGVDVETIRSSILTHEQEVMIRELRTLSLPLGGGVTAKVRDGVVTTIV